MRILVLTTLYPNRNLPSHGIFVENRLRAFKDQSGADVRVVAPIPWFPSSSSLFGQWAKWSGIPAQEQRYGIPILHPRYPVIPKIGMTLAPGALEQAFHRSFQFLLNQGWECDLIDAHYYYPDGVAAVRVAQSFKKPITVTARGTDINLIPNFDRQKRDVLEAASRADASITVAEALRQEMIRLGASGEKIHTLRNGVNLDQFQPVNRDNCRARWGLAGTVLLSVGHLIERKGHDIIIRALSELPDITLVIAGDGPEKKNLIALANAAGVNNRVRFIGFVRHEDLTELYNAADILTLASSREGWPNVLLEAMACGTPCIASNVWGTAEVIDDPETGRLVEHRTPGAFAAAIKDLLNTYPSREAVTAYAENFSWDDTAESIGALFAQIIKNRHIRDKMICKPAIHSNSLERPACIVTIDTEESFDWSNFDQVDYHLEDIADIDRFQAICSAENIDPLYFLTYPLINDQNIAAYFRKLAENNLASLGLHLHSWVTPPISTSFSPYTSYQKNLPQALHLEKLRTLANRFAEQFGFFAQTHRAGRYGISPENYPLLAEIGITHDFSPSAGFDFSKDGGPDFSRLSNDPFLISQPHPNHSDLSTTPPCVTVIPLAGGKAIKHTGFVKPNLGQLGFSTSRPSRRFNRIIDKATVPIRMSPEGNDLETMQAMAKSLVAAKTPVLTFSVHSSLFFDWG